MRQAPFHILATAGTTAGSVADLGLQTFWRQDTDKQTNKQMYMLVGYSDSEEQLSRIKRDVGRNSILNRWFRKTSLMGDTCKGTNRKRDKPCGYLRKKIAARRRERCSELSGSVRGQGKWNEGTM